jgi:hypothetical protein
MACKAVPPLLSFAGGLWLPESHLGPGDSAENSKQKSQQPHKLFLGELGVLLARVAIYLLNPFPGNSKPVAFEQLQDCAEATTELIPE